MVRRQKPLAREPLPVSKRKALTARQDLESSEIASTTTAAARKAARSHSPDHKVPSGSNDSQRSPYFQIVFGQNVKSVRKTTGLRQSEVAERAGLTQQRMSQIERGHQNVTLRTMIKLAEVLDRDVRDFLIGLRPAAKKSKPRE